MKKLLVLVRGMPGSGKTTLVNAMMDYTERWGTTPMLRRTVEHYEADMFFNTSSGGYNFDASKLGAAHSWCQTSTERAMRRGVKAVFVSNTFTTEKEMKPYFDLAEQYDYQLQVIDVCGSFENTHNVPEETMNKMRERYQENPKWLR
jgi:predicted kinase